MNERKQGSLTGFLKKIIISANWAILGPKIALPHNSGSTEKIFLTFCTVKGAYR